jgi:hypothetical protein
MKAPGSQFILSNDLDAGEVVEFPRVIRRDVLATLPASHAWFRGSVTKSPTPLP